MNGMGCPIGAYGDTTKNKDTMKGVRRRKKKKPKKPVRGTRWNMMG